MPDNLETAIAEEIGAAIENAQEEIEQAQDTADAIARAAMETELGRRVYEIERRFEEWQSNQSDQSEVTAALVLGMTELKAQLDLLILQQSPTQSLPSEEDGQRESQEETPLETVVIVEPEAPIQEPPPAPAPKKKRHNWI